MNKYILNGEERLSYETYSPSSYSSSSFPSCYGALLKTASYDAVFFCPLFFIKI